MGIMQVTKDENGKHRLSKLITVLGCLTLTAGFIKEAGTNGLNWEDYIAYAVAMTIMYMPSKAIELIRAIKGNDLPSPIPTSTKEVTT